MEVSIMKTLYFNNDVVVKVTNINRGLYDFNIYTDVNNEKVERDDDAYRSLCNGAYFYVSDDEKSYGLNRKTLCQILRKVKKATHETN